MRAIKIKIYPSKKQINALDQNFGACRWVYNYALEKKIKHYNDTKKSLSILKISNEITNLKKCEKTSWLKDANAVSIQQSLRHLDGAFQKFFNHQNRFPKFKSKHGKQSCNFLKHFKINLDQKYIKLPKIGWIKFRDKFNFNNKELKSIAVSKNTIGEFFASITFEYKDTKIKKKIDNKNTCGIDLGIKDFAILSNGQKIQNPKHIEKYLNKLKSQNQKLAKSKKGGNTRDKIKKSLSKTYKKIANSRKDFIHKTVNSLVENQDFVAFAIEDLAVKDMQEKSYKKLSQLIGDAGWRMFRTILEYKCNSVGKSALTIGRFEASSKTCVCGVKNHELKLDQREWTCNNCGAKHDRDILAANNIKNFALAKVNAKKLVGQSSLKG